MKAVSFDLSFKALGVSFDLTAAAKGAVTIELCQTIGEILACKTLSKAAALRLRGRMQFCDSFVFGRSSKLCLQAVTQHAHESVSEKVGGDLWASLFRFRDCLQDGKPHVIQSSHDDPLFIFTDACYEPGAEWCSGLGAALFDARGCFLAFFSLHVDAQGRQVLGEASKKTIIFELEFLAVITALVHWKSILRNRPIVMYLDNNTTRDIAISGRGRSLTAKALATALLTLEDEGELRAWYARVPSPSNVADLPSRQLCETMTVLGQTLAAENAEASMRSCLELLA